MQKILIVGLWAAFVLLYVRPEPGKGLPIGRRFWRHYLNGRQAIRWGAVLILVGLLVTLAGIGAESSDAVLFGVCVLWLGVPYLYHGRKLR